MAIRGREKKFTTAARKGTGNGFFWPVNGHELNLSSGEGGEMLTRGKGRGEEGIGKGSDKCKENQPLELNDIFSCHLLTLSFFLSISDLRFDDAAAAEGCCC